MVTLLERPVLQETPADYLPFKTGNFVYEVSLKTPPAHPWLKELGNTHRLLQTWLLGQSLGWYRLLDFVIQPTGFLLRLGLTQEASLADVLKFVRERSTPPGQAPGQSWVMEPAWLRLVPKDKNEESRTQFVKRSEILLGDRPLPSSTGPQLFFLFHES